MPVSDYLKFVAIDGELVICVEGVEQGYSNIESWSNRRTQELLIDYCLNQLVIFC